MLLRGRFGITVPVVRGAGAGWAWWGRQLLLFQLRVLLGLLQGKVSTLDTRLPPTVYPVSIHGTLIYRTEKSPRLVSSQSSAFSKKHPDSTQDRGRKREQRRSGPQPYAVPPLAPLIFPPWPPSTPTEMVGWSAGNWGCWSNPWVRFAQLKDLHLQTKQWTAAVTALHPFPSLSFQPDINHSSVAAR